MSERSFDDVMAALPGMSPEQRRCVVVACNVLGMEVGGGVDAPEDLLWRGYTRYAEECRVLLPSVGYARKMRDWAKLKRACQDLDPWVRKHFEIEDETERAAAYRLVARCVMRMVDDMELSWLPRILMQQAANATQAVERQFPGYAQGGLLRTVL